MGSPLPPLNSPPRVRGGAEGVCPGAGALRSCRYPPSLPLCIQLICLELSWRSRRMCSRRQCWHAAEPRSEPGRPESEAHLLLLRLPTHLAFTSYSKSFILFSACLLTGSFKSLGEEDHAYLVHLIHCVYVFTRRAQAGSAGRRSVGLVGGPRFLNADQRPVQ